MQLHFEDGHDFEKKVFDLPDKIVLECLGTFRPTSFREDVGRIIKSISRSKSGDRYPRTPIAKQLYFGVKKSLETLGIKARGLRLFSLIGTDADRYYETDALFYLPGSSGCECVVTIDAWLIDPTLLSQLRDYWIESSEDTVYSDLRFQGDIFAHNRMLSEYLGSQNGSVQGWKNSWALSPEYRKLWERAYLPQVPERMVDRPTVRPTNHLLLTPYHLEERYRRNAFVGLIATEFWKQIEPSL